MIESLFFRSDLFSLVRYTVHHGEVASRDASLVVKTVPDQWSYAVSLPKTRAATAAEGECCALVDVFVEAGRVGVGALASDGRTFVCEQEVGAEEGPVTVEFSARDIASCEELMIRNVQPGGERSRVVIESVRVYCGHGQSPSRNTSAQHAKDCFADLARLAGKPTGTIIDIGANVGGTVEKFLKTFPGSVIHAIEPTPELFDGLCDRFRTEPRVKIHRLAMSDHSGDIAFHRNKNHVTNSLLPWTATAGSFVEGSMALDSIIQVPCQNLTAFCAEQDITDIDVLKMDVQGAEGLVLAGASDLFAGHRIKLVLLEACFVPIYQGQTEFGDVLNFLQKHGYALFDLYDLRYSDIRQLKWGDALFFLASKG